jgi:hypothetical protein
MSHIRGVLSGDLHTAVLLLPPTLAAKLLPLQHIITRGACLDALHGPGLQHSQMRRAHDRAREVTGAISMLHRAAVTPCCRPPLHGKHSNGTMLLVLACAVPSRGILHMVPGVAPENALLGKQLSFFPSVSVCGVYRLSHRPWCAV